MERIARNGGVFIFIVVLLIKLIAVNSQCPRVACEPCERASYTTYNRWIEPPGTVKEEIYMSNTEFRLRSYQESDHEKYSFVTRFYECKNGKGTWISTEIKRIFLANHRSSSQGVLLWFDDPGAQPCHCHPALFKFENGSNEALGLLRSASQESRQFLDSSDSRLSFSETDRKWVVLPSVTQKIPSAESFRPGSTNVTMEDEKGVFVNDQQRLDVKIWIPGAPEFSFRIEVFGLCKRDETSQDLIQSRAILLSVILQNEHSRVLKYLQVAVTDEGQVALPFGGRHRSYHFPLRYNKVQLRTDDVRESRELYATYLRPRTNNEETIDERYFEVIRQRSGTYRIKTVINPNLYLAVINVRGRLMFVVTTYDARLPRNIADYDFNINVPVTPVNNCAQPQPPRQEMTGSVSSPTRRRSPFDNRNRDVEY